MPRCQADKPENSGDTGRALPTKKASSWLILVGSIATCAILFGLYNKFFKDFTHSAMWKTWATSYEICSRMYETHEKVVKTFILFETNKTFCTIAPYLPKVPDPGDWLNGRISIV